MPGDKLFTSIAFNPHCVLIFCKINPPNALYTLIDVGWLKQSLEFISRYKKSFAGFGYNLKSFSSSDSVTDVKIYVVSQVAAKPVSYKPNSESS